MNRKRRRDYWVESWKFASKGPGGCNLTETLHPPTTAQDSLKLARNCSRLFDSRKGQRQRMGREKNIAPVRLLRVNKEKATTKEEGERFIWRDKEATSLWLPLKTLSYPPEGNLKRERKGEVTEPNPGTAGWAVRWSGTPIPMQKP